MYVHANMLTTFKKYIQEQYKKLKDAHVYISDKNNNLNLTVALNERCFNSG